MLLYYLIEKQVDCLDRRNKIIIGDEGRQIRAGHLSLQLYPENQDRRLPLTLKMGHCLHVKVSTVPVLQSDVLTGLEIFKAYSYRSC
jgi:hypothetical protein